MLLDGLHVLVDVVAECETVAAQEDGDDGEEHEGDGTVSQRVAVRFEE